jgi:hypothetical protein
MRKHLLTRKRLLPSLVCGVSSLMAFASGAALACSCAPPPAPKVALERATAVFAGKVTSVEEKGHQKQVTFEVRRSWKGIAGDTVMVTTASHSAACGFNFEVQKEYLVYGSKGENAEFLSTNICTRTKPLAQARDDLAELGEGTAHPKK